MPFLIDQKVMRQIENDFGHELEITSSHKSRKRNDIQYEMMYWYYIIVKVYHIVDIANSYSYDNPDIRI